MPSGIYVPALCSSCHCHSLYSRWQLSFTIYSFHINNLISTSISFFNLQSFRECEFGSMYGKCHLKSVSWHFVFLSSPLNIFSVSLHFHLHFNVFITFYLQCPVTCKVFILMYCFHFPVQFSFSCTVLIFRLSSFFRLLAWITHITHFNTELGILSRYTLQYWTRLSGPRYITILGFVINLDSGEKGNKETAWYKTLSTNIQQAGHQYK